MYSTTPGIHLPTQMQCPFIIERERIKQMWNHTAIITIKIYDKPNWIHVFALVSHNKQKFMKHIIIFHYLFHVK